MSTTLPPISTVPALDTEARAAILDLLFEPCTQLHTLSVSTLREKTFQSYDELAAAVGEQLTTLFESEMKSDQEWLDVILNAHPRLGEKKVESELSRREQAAMNGSGAEDSAVVEEEAEELRRLNARYENVYEGLRFVWVMFYFWSWLLRDRLIYFRKSIATIYRYL
jgi:2-oxo-4-hydroxy-4-carboxy--5-ureidoimidazoline (OHCU) decarboxylase